MNVQKISWKERDAWGRKEFVLLMLLEFGFVIGCIKFVLHPMYSRWLHNDLYAGTLMGLTIAVVLILGVYAVALRPKGLSWTEVGLKPFDRKNWKLIALSSVALLVGAVIIMELTSFLGNTYENSKTVALRENTTFLAVLIAFITGAVISPLYEEIFYRGFLYRWLRTRVGLTGALLLSASIFTLIHIPTYNVMPANFWSGVIFAYAYERTGSIWPSVIIHGVTNGIMVLLTVMVG
ncbi:CPBP family intramembrane metalloprotease [Paenibacillus faecis]|uniref:CPBP family intramembrane metalloprotease n=1 Tax=Paenibacillus faecis TaxID=862114 RepID=A0A5D0CKY5_9BACL|nr:type II CAAX endopeptidase family protein [Paenibacillus faecis]TYA10669.1 CPBP family intramembrane metalloprotease [Paenibacillus faecis]